MAQTCGGAVGAGVLAAYDRQGFALLDVALSAKDVASIERYLQQREATAHPGNVKDGAGLLRAVHGWEDGVLSEGTMAKLRAASCAVIGCDAVYLYQFRVNVKRPTSNAAGGWSPHRDFDFWHRMDGMPHPKAVVVHFFLTDHTPENGPLVLCDGSHRVDAALHVAKEDDDGDWQAGFTEDLKYTVDTDAVHAWATKTTAAP